ncbi:peptidoglycan DD-metalloendopeptidase family protein [Phytoactinopolyspora endophytica]|uniref:peptidoglycan DD-metalloendopeptidase family protein n=1 Tax=Phytoactinopolyspora endophytica TaxID=1642495 RepID=UPI00101B9AB2|nr:peptidoglycan DD-metalloendopeptidase family protein [Phytoactinopolyspora endophytica]
MQRPRRDVYAVAAACTGLVLATAGMSAHAEPTSPAASAFVPTSATPPADEGEPSDEPEDEASDLPSDAPTSPPAESPDDPGDLDRRDPSEAYDEALADAQTAAVAEAQRLLQEVLGEVDDAGDRLEQATADAEAAREAEEEARRQIKVAEESIERTQREMEETETSAEGAKATLGSVAREAYQNNGLTTVGVVLGAESPEELSDRYLDMRTLLEASDNALGRLATDQADLRNAASNLEGQRKEKERLAEQAAESLADAEAAETAAEEAQAEHEEKQAQVEEALDLAEDARLEDYELYMEQMDESTAITEYLNNLPDPSPEPAPDGDGSSDDSGGGSDDGGSGTGNGTGSFTLPANGSVTSEYGSRLHPILGYVKMHTGIDFSGSDSNIYAADSGTVVEATFNTAYGNMVIVDHGMMNGQRVTTLYAHQSGLSVSAGQRVEKGEVIGQIGSTGYSTGPHLHFEVRLDGQHTNPRSYLPL